MPRDRGSSIRWGSHKSTVRGVPIKRYASLILPHVSVPDVRVDVQTWERIACGMPRGYVFPDEMLLREIVEVMKAREQMEQQQREQSPAEQRTEEV